MLNRRKLFSFLATAPVATVIGAKAAMDANGNDVGPRSLMEMKLRGDFFYPSETRWMEMESQLLTALRQQRLHDPRSQRLRS